MSTKAIRELAAGTAERLAAKLARAGLTRAQRASFQHHLETARKALSEVEAIEKAAKFITTVDTLRAPDPDDMRDASDTKTLMESIAKETK